MTPRRLIIRSITGRSFAGLSCTATLALALACSPVQSAQKPAEAAAAASPGAQTTASESSAPGTLNAQVLAMMPRGLTTFGVVTHHGSLYMLGGYFGTPHAYSKEYQSGDFVRLDLASGAWEKLPPVEPIQSVSLVSDGEFIYRIGGMQARNVEGKPQDLQSVSEVKRFDPKTQAWSALPDLPAPRSSHVAVVVSNKLYVIGGWRLAGDPNDEQWSTTLLSCDLGQTPCVWQESPVEFKARAFGAAALGDKIFVLGGLTPSEDEAKSVFVYDTKAGSWSRGPDFPGQSISIRAASYKGNLYANGSDGVVYQLSADQASWQPSASFLYPRLFHELVSDEQLGPLALGGIPSAARGARIRVIEQLSAAAPAAGVVWTLPAQSPAKNRQGAFVSGQHLYAFGGNTSLEQHDFERERFVRETRRLDLGSWEWKALADFPAPRQSMQTLLVGDEESRRGVALGGFGWSDKHLSSQSDVYSYDPSKDKWSPYGAPLPVSLSQFGSAVWGDALWVIGGLNYDTSREKNDQFRHSAAIQRLDLKAPNARFVDAGFGLGEPRRAFAGALLGDRYYLFGGMKEDFALVPSCQAVDFKARAVMNVSCPKITRLSAELVALDGKLYLIAGSAKSGDDVAPNTSIEVYDPGQDRWSTLTEALPLPDTAQLRAFAFQDRLLLYTAQHEGPSVEVALLDPKALAAGSTEYRRITLP